MVIRYEDMRVDRLLIKEYQKQLETELRAISGLKDIEKSLQFFEARFAEYIGSRHAIAVNSGTDALQLSLAALGVGKGDSVLIPNVTYPAVALSVIYSGAVPICVDIKNERPVMDEKFIERAIKKNTKAIIAVHMFAYPCNIVSIREIARRHNLFIIEDCCQAESSQYQGRKLGSFGDLACFSFSYYKPLSSCGGGGGMVCFNDEKYRKILDYTKIWQDDELLLEAGKRFSRMYLLDLISIKVKFKYLNEIKKSRLAIKKMYEEGLRGVKGIEIFPDAENTVSLPQNFVIYSIARDKLGSYISKLGIIWQKPYTPLHLMSMYMKFAKGKFPCSERYNKMAIQLPLFSFMKTEEAAYIIDVIRKFSNASS